jgi:UDPglucose 6-dehydrogenase
MIERLSVIGLGKLGLPMAVLFASKGFKVIGVDVNQEILKAINEKRCPIYEPGVSELLKKYSGSIIATDDYRYASENSEASFIVVPTPSEESGGFATRYAEAAGAKIAENLKHKNDFHLIVLTSTVLPGATARLKELLERNSGKRCGVNFGLCYSPEFIALGSVLHGLSSPDFILIGESDPKSGGLLSDIYRKICENNPPIVRTNFWNAEIGKILLNSYLTMKISFANMLAELCERIPGGDVDVVSQILGLDSRIGRKYMTGGLAFGGPCFPRDNRAVVYFAQTIGIDARLPKTTHEVNLYQRKRIVELVKQKINEPKGKKVAILGLTYKPDTDVVEESASLDIAKALLVEGARVSVYDPTGMENAKLVLGQEVEYTNSIEECLKDAEFCILATPWAEFKSLKPEDFTKTMKQPVILDCWRIFNPPDYKEKLEYFAIGLSNREGIESG